jgi:hypothetical protein
MTDPVVDAGQPAASGIAFTDTTAPVVTNTDTPAVSFTDTQQDASQAAALPQIDLNTVKDPDMVQFYKDAAELGEVTLVGGEGSQPPKEGDPEPEPNPASAEVKPKDTDKGQQPAPMIPKARFDEVRSRAETAEQKAAYWRGVAEARAADHPPANAGGQDQSQDQGRQQQITFEQQIAELAAQEDAIAERFDNGEIDAKTMNAELRTVRQQEAALREANLHEQIRQAVPKAPTVDDVKAQIESEQQAVALYQANPLAGLVFPENGSAQAQAEIQDPAYREIMDTRRELVKVEARQALLRDHPGIQGPQADVLFREYLAHTANAYAATWFPNEAAKVAAPAAKPGLSPTAQARLDKMSVAAAQPPNPANLGTSQGVADQWTPERYAALSDDQLARLPAHVHERFA